MSENTRRKILQKWSGFDPYLQRVLINRFHDLNGREASREEWLEFLFLELEEDLALSV